MAQGLLPSGKRIWQRIGDNHLSLIAAGVAFYAMFGLFPAITAIMAIAALLTTPGDIVAQLDALSTVVPEDVARTVISQASAVAAAPGTGLGLTAIFGLGLALWSASRGVGSLIQGLNVAYGAREERGFIHLTLVTLGLTLAAVVGVVIVLSLIALLPALFAIFGEDDLFIRMANWLRWPVLFATMILGLSMLYRLGPCGSLGRRFAPGAALACLLWLLVSMGFSIYVSHFASYNETFGALGSVIVLLMWLWLSTFIVLLGAEVNAELQRLGGDGKSPTDGIRPARSLG